MLEQVLQQIASTTEAKSNQRQIQTLASRLLVLEMQVETSIHSVAYVTREAPTAWMGQNR